MSTVRSAALSSSAWSTISISLEVSATRLTTVHTYLHWCFFYIFSTVNPLQKSPVSLPEKTYISCMSMPFTSTTAVNSCNMFWVFTHCDIMGNLYQFTQAFRESSLTLSSPSNYLGIFYTYEDLTCFLFSSEGLEISPVSLTD